MLDGAFLLNGLASNTTYISSIRDETKDTIKEKIGKDEKKRIDMKRNVCILWRLAVVMDDL